MKNKDIIKLLLVDDSLIHLEGLKLILREHGNIKVTAQAGNSREALEHLAKDMPDIILLDISLEKDMDGIELARVIKEQYPDVRIIFLTHYKGTRYLMNALQTCPAAYLPKDLTPEELVNTIMSVNNGKGVYLGDTIPLFHILEVFGSEENAGKGRIYDLTPREIEVIKYLVQGYSTKELASRLGIEVNTVESYKDRIKEKLGVKTVVQIVVTAIKKGIVNIEN
ncbi:MAG: response regulator transcription factor [Bacteroidales bacterium]|jgi:two-component system response regulator NreC|nr:response regulator transcription factor [Bacteroidales bacterium]